MFHIFAIYKTVGYAMPNLARNFENKLICKLINESCKLNYTSSCSIVAFMFFFLFGNNRATDFIRL